MSKHGGYEDLAILAEYYDHNPIYVSRADVEFYVEEAKAAKGKILELGCGTGRILIPTAAGCEIVGLDVSKHMLAKCREKILEQPEEVQKRIQVVEGNMVDFDLKERFALVTIPFRPFQHLLAVEEQMSCLRCVNRHLEVGGRFILDVFHVNPQMTHDPKFQTESEDIPEVELPDGRKVLLRWRIAAYHRAEQYNEIEFVYYVSHPEGREERLVQAFPFRYFYRYELEHLLARCGFRVVELFGSHDRSPFEDSSPEVIFVAEKGEEIEGI